MKKSNVMIPSSGRKYFDLDYAKFMSKLTGR